jgi:hypothetical protein
MATAMDANPAVIGGHNFHHSAVIAALDTHATIGHSQASNAIALHDAGNTAAANGFTAV